MTQTTAATSPVSYQTAISSQLMTNHAPARAVDAQQQFDVVEDTNGNPIVFSIGTDGAFRVITIDQGGMSGWQLIEINPVVGNVATTFGVAQDAAGMITLAVVSTAPGQAAGHGPGILFLSPPISNDPTVTEWSKVAGAMVARPWTTGTVVITDLLVGVGAPGVLPLVIAVVNDAGTVARYQVNPDTGDTAWFWKPFVLPETVNTDGILGLAVGTVFGDLGVFALYEVGSVASLEFTSLPDPKFHKTSNYSFRVPADTTCFDVTPGHGNSSDVYAAGAGIIVFVGSSSTSSVVATEAQAPAVSHILARFDGDDTSVWAVSGDEQLVYTHGDGASWSDPLALMGSIGEIAALRSRTRKNNQILFVTGDDALGYTWQDSTTSMWQNVVVPLPDPGEVTTFTSYTTQIKVTDQQNDPAPDLALSVSSSQTQFVTVNGGSHLIGPGAVALVTTDVTGMLTVITPVSTISTAVLHVAGLGELIVDVNPAGPILTQLSALKSGSDLKTATFRSGPRAGELVLANPPSDATLDATASAIGQLTSMASSLPIDGAPASTTTVPHSAARLATSPSLAAIAPAAGADTTWGVIVGDTVEFVTGREATAALKSLGGAIEQAAGDVLLWLEGAVEEVSAFFIEALDDAWRFVVKIGDDVLNMVIDAVEHVASAINWVLKNILSIDLHAILQWFGFLFDWGDIKLTHRVIVNIANLTIDYGEAKLDQLAGSMAAGFEWLKQQLATLEPPGHVNDQVRSKGTSEQKSAASTSLVTGLAAPSSSWGTYHLMHSGATNAAAPMRTPTDPLTAFYNDVLQPTITSIADTFQNIGQDVIEGFNGDLTVVEMFQAMGVDALIGVLDALETAIVGVIEFVEDLVEWLRDAANATIDVPFFSAMYRNISGDDLSLLDLVALVCAIPMTIGYKLLAGEAPFAHDAYGLDDPSTTWQTAFALLGTDTSPPTSTTSLPSAAEFAERPAVGLASFAALPESPSADPPEGSDAARTYSYVGGLANMVLGGVDDVLAIMEAKEKVAAVSSEIEKSEAAVAKIGTLEIIRFCLGVGKAGFTFPVGHDKEVGLQRAVWGIYLGVDVVELLVLIVAQRTEPAGAAKAVQINGGITIVETVVVFVMECVIFAEEMSTLTDETTGTDDRTANILKFFQNIFYAVAHIGVGVGELLPPEDLEDQGLAALAAGAGLALAEVMSLVVLMENFLIGAEHQNF